MLHSRQEVREWAVWGHVQERDTPAEVLELPAKTDRIHHFAWEPHVRALHPLCSLQSLH